MDESHEVDWSGPYQTFGILISMHFSISISILAIVSQKRMNNLQCLCSTSTTSNGSSGQLMLSPATSLCSMSFFFPCLCPPSSSSSSSSSSKLLSLRSSIKADNNHSGIERLSKQLGKVVDVMEQEQEQRAAAATLSIKVPAVVGVGNRSLDSILKPHQKIEKAFLLTTVL
jgi:hypothetical protein